MKRLWGVLEPPWKRFMPHAPNGASVGTYGGSNSNDVGVSTPRGHSLISVVLLVEPRHLGELKRDYSSCGKTTVPTSRPSTIAMVAEQPKPVLKVRSARWANAGSRREKNAQHRHTDTLTHTHTHARTHTHTYTHTTHMLGILRGPCVSL